ncbi:hypothetical protein FRUB_04460 [Fimbriiglobus ruber]|uniref:Uncharacterized protein n=2 Tax=Fimbriiglobus ruber TaxID=1908690 RepID=A0A225DLX8_9BACT|nr:hypothetical protein FRUB_04460 [Fimbriiglobus ruber]
MGSGAGGMNIAGKPLTDLINELPYGKFGEIVRKEIDPLWGKNQNDMKAFRVVMRYVPKQEPEEHAVTVEAKDEEEAKKLAYDQAADELSYEELWVHKLIEIGV